MYHGSPVPFAVYAVGKDTLTPGSNRDRQGGNGGGSEKSVYISPNFPTAEKYADFCVFPDRPAQLQELEWLDEVPKASVVIELLTYQALSTGGKRPHIRRLADSSQAQLTGIWLTGLSNYFG